jgi:phosphatidylserine decarboxylase
VQAASDAAVTAAPVIEHEPPLAQAEAVTCVQPHGGWCFRLEVAWGRYRRGMLRALRPGYVRRMQAARQGECTSCPHDVIDPRDLKLVRNVCGFSFRPEDDRFRWRDRIPLARYGLAECVFSTLFAGPAFLAVLAIAIRTNDPGAWMFASMFGWLWFQLLWFFRDPTRVASTDPDVMVSPADGVVTDIDEVIAPDFPGNRATRISIYLSVWNVHLSRVPRSGRVIGMRYFRGAFINAMSRDCVRRNEQLWLDYVEPNGRLIRVKQFSGALARRIVCHVKVGEEIKAGDRYGIIKYGSRADVLIPTGEDITWLVNVGDVVAGATTVLARFGKGRAS